MKDLYFGNSKYLKLNSFVNDSVHLARTGYTGEDGFEMSIKAGNEAEAEQSRQFFESLIEEHPDVVAPIGLAARDSLRLEAGMCLYGNELTEDITPIEASLAWLIPKSRREPATATFNGASKILEQLNNKGLVTRRRIGVTSKGPAPRGGAKIYHDGNEVGYISSGSLSPTLGLNVAQSYLDKTVKIGSTVQLDIRGKLRDGVVTKLPFVPNNFYKG